MMMWQKGRSLARSCIRARLEAISLSCCNTHNQGLNHRLFNETAINANAATNAATNAARYDGTSDRCTKNTKHHTPVLIVGGGPTGMLLAHLLHSYGTPFTLLEARSADQVCSHPQAHFLNTRTMEILRHSCPGNTLYRRTVETMPPSNEWQYFNFSHSFSDARDSRKLIARVSHPVTKPLQQDMEDSNGKLLPEYHNAQDYNPTETTTQLNEQAQLSVCSVGHLSQDQFCQILLDELLAKLQNSCSPDSDNTISKPFTSSSVHHCVKVKSVQSDSNHGDGENSPMTVHVEDKETGQSWALTADYIVAANGSKSNLRNSNLMKGQSDMQHLANVHFRLHHHNPYTFPNKAMLHFIYHPELVGVVVCHDWDRGNFVLQVPYFPPYQSLENDFSEAKVRAILSAVGVPQNNGLEIVSIRSWTMSSLVSESFVAKEQNIVLVGDAAHVFPPAGGFGMNTGLQDAHNLAWRLSYLVDQQQQQQQQKTKNARKVLALYEKERRLVAQQNAALSVRNYNRTLQLAKACFLDADHPATLIKALDASSFFVPFEARRATFHQLMRTATMTLGVLKEGTNFHARNIVRRVRRLLDSGGGLPLVFPKFELGFCYEKQKVDAKCSGHESNDWSRDTEAYQPLIRTGERLAHVLMKVIYPKEDRIEELFPNLVPVENSIITITDISSQVRNRKPCFVLLLLIDHEQTKVHDISYVRMLQQVEAETGVQIRLVVVAENLTPVADWELIPDDGVLILQDEHSNFRSLLRSSNENNNHAQGVVVRPDGHVAGVIGTHDDILSTIAMSVSEALGNIG